MSTTQQSSLVILVLAIILILSCTTASTEDVNLTVTFTAPGDDGFEGTATAYRLAYSQDYDELVNTMTPTEFTLNYSYYDPVSGTMVDTSMTYTRMIPTGGTEVPNLPIPPPGGTPDTISFSLTLNYGTWYFALWAVDEAHNYGMHSNVIHIIVGDEIQPAQIIDLDWM